MVVSAFSEKNFTIYVFTMSIMAKDKEEKYKFEIPEFDESEYIQKELRDTKISLLVLGYGMLFSFISFLIGRLSFAAAFAIGALAVFGLKFLFIVAKTDLSKIDKKAWLSTALIYIITWLAFWTLWYNTIF